MFARLVFVFVFFGYDVLLGFLTYIFHNSICSANFPETVRRLIFGRCHHHHGSHTQPGQCQASLEWGRWRSSGRRRTMKTENANVVTSDQCTAPRINSSGSLRTHLLCPPVRRTCCSKVLCNSEEVSQEHKPH